MQSCAQDFVADPPNVDFVVVNSELYLPVETAVLRNAPIDAGSSLLTHGVFLGATFHDNLIVGNDF